ncbi:MAG: hypothetical protein WDA08_11870 [Weeksellaceae bacterium]
MNPSYKDFIIVVICIIGFLIFGYCWNIYAKNNRQNLYKNKKYTIGIITQRRTETRSDYYRYSYNVYNYQQNGRFSFLLKGKYANLKIDHKYFIMFDSLKPKNSVLLPFLPVPDSITSAPPEGWKELPISVDKEEIRKFLEDY